MSGRPRLLPPPASRRPPSYLGLPVVVSGFYKDGEVLHMRGVGTIVIGTRPWDEREVDVERARRIVRTGLAHVLEWVGEEPGPAPDDPYPAMGGREMLERLAGKPENHR